LAHVTRHFTTNLLAGEDKYEIAPPSDRWQMEHKR